MVIQIVPEEGISLRFGAKVPDAVMSIGQVNMDFDYERYFGQSQNTGYE
jgi:glucose-6-phosphate 1-dehydrogenase